MKAVIGLGNPGAPYARTRHNLGRMAIHRYLKRSAKEKMKKSEQNFSLIYQLEEKLIVEPLTYMNLSGIAVKEVCDVFSLKFADCLLVYDEYAVSFGKIKAKPGGGAGGHNGVASVIEELSTRDIPRLRLGIGREIKLSDLVRFVLEEFDEEEKKRLPEFLDQAADAIECFFTEDLNAVMNRFNV
jgi:PTH1 family peptidyl-tRNA hydrolase